MPCSPDGLRFHLATTPRGLAKSQPTGREAGAPVPSDSRGYRGS